ncbi:MAG: DUF6160 family protein [Pseudomonadota bacterium]
MTFKKLALVSAIAAAPMGAHAVDMLDDSMLSGVTGQDGVAVSLSLNVTTNAIVHDTDGIDNVSTTYSFDGAIIMTGVALNTNGNAIRLEIDAGDVTTAAGTAPVLNVNVSIPTGTTIQTGDLTVGNSNRDDAGAWGFEAATESGVIMQNATITLGATTANIQLGNEAQGNMIQIDTVITGGISIANSALIDAGGIASLTGGAIGSSNMTIVDNGGTDLTVDAGVDVDEGQGLVITLNQLGAAATGFDVRIERQYLGTTTLGYIGDVELTGVNLNGSTIAVSGK